MIDSSKKKIIISVVVAGLVLAGVIGTIAYVRNRREIEATTQSLNSLLKKVRKKHPKIFEWWNTLPPQSQRTIEDTMTTEMLTFLNTEFSKNKLSPKVLDVLRRVGYTG